MTRNVSGIACSESAHGSTEEYNALFVFRVRRHFELYREYFCHRFIYIVNILIFINKSLLNSMFTYSIWNSSSKFKGHSIRFGKDSVTIINCTQYIWGMLFLFVRSTFTFEGRGKQPVKCSHINCHFEKTEFEVLE